MLAEPAKPYGSIKRYGSANVARVKFVKAAQRLGGKRADLRRIENGAFGETCTISAAARTLGMSYAGAWRQTVNMNAVFQERLVDTNVCGNRRGGAAVSRIGRKLLELYESIGEEPERAVVKKLTAMNTIGALAHRLRPVDDGTFKVSARKADMNPAPDNIPKLQRKASAAKSGLRWKWLLYLLIAAAAIGAANYFHVQDLLEQGLDRVARLGLWGPVIFIGLYVVATVLFIPGSVLTLGAGAVFGVVWGSIYVSIASTLGATAAFLVGRYLARDAIARKIEDNPRFTAIDKAVANEGWKIVGLTRLSPVFPFTLLNYAFGLTQVKLRDYALASWIGMMPGTIMYVYLGSLAQAATGDHARTTGEWVLYGVGLLATVVVTVFVTRLAKKALAKRITH